MSTELDQREDRIDKAGNQQSEGRLATARLLFGQRQMLRAKLATAADLETKKQLTNAVIQTERAITQEVNQAVYNLLGSSPEQANPEKMLAILRERLRLDLVMPGLYRKLEQELQRSQPDRLKRLIGAILYYTVCSTIDLFGVSIPVVGLMSEPLSDLLIAKTVRFAFRRLGLIESDNINAHDQGLAIIAGLGVEGANILTAGLAGNTVGTLINPALFYLLRVLKSV